MKLEILRSLDKGDLYHFDISVDEQKKYIERLGAPTNIWDRSYKQYLCKCYLIRPKIKLLLFDFFSFLILPFLVVVGVSRGLFKKRKSYKNVEAICEFVNMKEVVPDSLNDEFDLCYDYNFAKLTISLHDVLFFFKFWTQYILHPYFVIKCFLKICRYSDLIEVYKPRAIIVHNEISFTSSVLTSLCRKRGVLHINVMHGEKLYLIRESFFEFDRCYVWHEHYKDLFCKLRADEKQFIIELPPSMRITKNVGHNKSIYSDYKYYLADCSEDEVRKIVSTMNRILKPGETIKYRFHPRYPISNILAQYVETSCIENPSDVDIISSLINTKNVVGSYSTVLLQAYFASKNVILDDVTYKNQFVKLKELDYILANKDLTLLSQTIKA